MMMMQRMSVLSVSLGAMVGLIACTGAAQQSREANQKREPAVAAATPVATPASQSAESPRRVTPAELQQALEKGEAVAVDVRGQSSYEAGHIKGALHIPLGEVKDRAGELPRDKMIVTYCS